MRLIPVVLMILLVPATTATADGFDTAMDRWLAVEDEQALPALADLAAAGDERAMMALNEIDTHWPASGWLGSLDRKSRNAILRAPGGLSGRSWLTRVKDQRALADAMTYTPGVDDFADRAQALFSMGESAAGRSVAMIAFNQQPDSLAAIDAMAPVPPIMDHLLWYSAGFAGNPLFFAAGGTRPPTPHEAKLMAEVASTQVKDSFQHRVYLSMFYPDASAAGIPQADYLTNTVLRVGERSADGMSAFGDPVAPGKESTAERMLAYEAAADLLMQAPELAPIRALCKAACAEAPRDCVRTVYGETLGTASLVNLGSPLATLTPEDRYFSSPRYLDDLRHAAQPLTARLIPPPAHAACGIALLHP